MGFDFFGADVDLQIYLQQGVQLSPGRYSVDSAGNRVANPQDPDVVRVGMSASFLQTNPASQQVLLVNGPTAGDATKAPLDFLRSMMTKMEMEIGLSLIPKIQITIDPPSNDMALAMLNSNVFAFGNALAVKFGYTRSPFESFPGGKDAELFLLLKPDVAFGETLSFTLHGLGMGLAGAQRAQRSLTYDNMSPEQVVSAIAVRNGLTMKKPTFGILPLLSALPGVTGAVAQGVQNLAQQAWLTKKQGWQQTSKTDWEFLHEVLEHVPGKMSFRLEGNQLILDSFIVQMAAAPKAIFRWYHAPKLNTSATQLSGNDELPILGFSSDTNLAFYPGAAAGVITNTGIGRDSLRPAAKNTALINGQDVASDSATPTVARFATQTLASTNLGNMPDLQVGDQRTAAFGAFKGLAGGFSVTQSPTTAPNTLEISRNLAQEAQFFGNFNITIDTIGVPSLRPGDLIELKGFETVGTVTEKLNGKFLVKKLLHTFGPEGFVTKITALRNATPGEGVRAGGTQNVQAPAPFSQGANLEKLPLSADEQNSSFA